MIKQSVLLLAIVLGATVLALRLPEEKTNEAPTLPDQWFNQYVDHFKITDNRQWKQKYQLMTDYYMEGGAVFLDIGGEGPISGKDLPHRTSTQFAKDYGAMVFQLETRFYGESRPTSDASTANLAYLSSDQALVDIAYFIKAMTDEHKLPEGTKWIVFGGSYGASLAVWMRHKYPHLVYGAVADSGALLAKVDFNDYQNNVRDTLAAYNPECVKGIQEAHNKVKEMLKTPEGQKAVHDKFKMCDAINTSKKHDVTFLLASLIDNFSGVVQYNGTEGGLTIKDICDVMVDTKLGDVIERYVKVNNMVNEADGSTCNNNKFEKVMNSLKKSSWKDEMVQSGARSWSYQGCAELGYFQTSDHSTDFFFEDLPLDWFIEQCNFMFGDKFTKDLAYKAEYRTNLLYGGLDTQATRVVYVYSETDPWHVLGVSKTKDEDSPVFMVKGGWHESIIEGMKKTYPDEVRYSWADVEEVVGNWCTA